MLNELKLKNKMNDRELGTKQGIIDMSEYNDSKKTNGVESILESSLDIVEREFDKIDSKAFAENDLVKSE